MLEMFGFWRKTAPSKPASHSSAPHDDDQTALPTLMAKIAQFQLTDPVIVGSLRGCGGFADVYEGNLKVKGTDEVKKVAIKKFRVAGAEEEVFAKRFEREMLIWDKLKHENVLPLLGMMAIDGLPCLVSAWMENGTMNAYLKVHRDANLLDLVQGIANGLAFLHNHGVVHADIKGDNILISEDGNALLSDFGTSRLLLNNVTVAGTQAFKGSIPWMAPELLSSDGRPREHQFHTNATDVWAFGMTVYEAISQKMPYVDKGNDVSIILSIMDGALPVKPNLTASGGWHAEILWKCCLDCWHQDAANRPSMMEVVERMKGLRVIAGAMFGVDRLNRYQNIKIERAAEHSHCANGCFGRLLPGKDSAGNAGVRVSITRIQHIVKEETAFSEEFVKYVNTWETLKHENILQLLGVTVMDGTLCTVSEWMPNGSLIAYLKDRPDANALELMKGIANGLMYLHLRGVVHSNLNGETVLISKNKRAILSDFGRSRLLTNNVMIPGTQLVRGTARWTAPELLLQAEQSLGVLHTKASDIWAFGMVAYELLVRDVPFYAQRNEEEVVVLVCKGEAPPRPDGSRVDEFELVWDCCLRCWNRIPAYRPSMRRILAKLKKEVCVVKSIEPLSVSHSRMSPTGRFLATIADDQRSISFLEIRTMKQYRPDMSVKSKVYQVAWSSTDDNLATVSQEGTLQKWKDILESAALVAQSTKRHFCCSSLDFSPDDKLIVSSDLKAAKLWDASNLSLVWEYSGFLQSMAFHPFGQKFYFLHQYYISNIITEDGNVRTATEHKLDYWASRLVLNPRGKACAVSTDLGVKILSTDTFGEKTTLPYRDCEALQYTPDGKYILLLLESQKVILWDISASEAVEELALNLEFDGRWNAEISKNCCTLRLHNHHYTRIVRLMSTYF